MRILMLASGTIHSSLSHRVLSLGRQFVAAGHHVTILAPSADKYSGFQPDTPAAIDGVQLVYPKQFRTRSYLVSLMPYLLSSLYHVLRHQADLIYLYKPTPITITGLAAKLFKRTPVVLDMDDLGSEVMRIEHQPAPVVWLVEQCEKLAARYANGIIAASTLLERQFRVQYPHKPILRLPNGVNPAEFTARSHRTKPHLMFFGALGRQNILEPVIQAMPAIIKQAGPSGVQLDIFGDGAYRAHFEQLATRLGVQDHVLFHGWTSFADLCEQTSTADIALCIMPNERTTAACSNQKVFQYLALGAHVIATEVGDLPIYLENGSAGTIVKTNHPDDLADTIAKLLGDNPARATRARRGQVLARTTYAWTTLATQAQDFFKVIITGAPQ